MTIFAANLKLIDRNGPAQRVDKSILESFQKMPIMSSEYAGQIPDSYFAGLGTNTPAPNGEKTLPTFQYQKKPMPSAMPNQPT